MRSCLAAVNYLICGLSQTKLNHPLSSSLSRSFKFQLFTEKPARQFSNLQFSKKLKEKKVQKVMADVKFKDILLPLQTAVKQKGDEVRSLKERKAPENDLKAALKDLKAVKKILEDKILELEDGEGDGPIDRLKLEDLLKQKFFYDQSAAIYGGVAGLYDFGPMGCAMKTNLLSEWRKFFIDEEDMLEVDTSILTPEPVLKASGHVDRFADYMVKDLKTGECFRADHLIEAHIEKALVDKKLSEEVLTEMRDLLPKIDGFSKEDMASTMVKYDIKSPLSHNDISPPQQFNLMFHTHIGPTGDLKGYLRPETAQGIFVNFKRLLEDNEGVLPFATAQIGRAFRNEISPRSGLIRVREFTMAEIEHFCDPNDKSHPKFNNIKVTELNLYSAHNQMNGELSTMVPVGEAVTSGLIANETLGYFLARVHCFLLRMGIRSDKLRFRQHMANEMAHYACDCWDAECKTSYGWVECVGNADRSCYDLEQHSNSTGVKLLAEKKLETPEERDMVEVVANKSLLGKHFRQDSKALIDALTSLPSCPQFSHYEELLQKDGSFTLKVKDKEFKIEKEMLEVKKFKKTVYVEKFTPSVIEPSFGVGRIMYSILEQSFRVRENDEQRTYLSLPALISPFKCSVLPLSVNQEFVPYVNQLSEQLKQKGVRCKVFRSSGVAIGRRYARADQLGIPFGITVDFDTANKQPPTATLRERDSMKQIRVQLTELPELVRSLASKEMEWEGVCKQYPVFEQQETE